MTPEPHAAERDAVVQAVSGVRAGAAVAALMRLHAESPTPVMVFAAVAELAVTALVVLSRGDVESNPLDVVLPDLGGPA